MGRSSHGLSNAIPVILTTVVLLLVALGTTPLVGQAQDTINNSKNALPEGALESGPLGEAEENSDDGEPGVTGPEDGDSETGRDGAFTGVQFNNPPEAVAAGSTETFEATASADQPLGGATFTVRSEDRGIITSDSANCNNPDDNTQCKVEEELEIPDSEEPYKATVTVDFQTDSGPSEFAETTVNVVSVSLNSDSGKFDATAEAAEGILTQARLRWTTEADVEPSESIANTVDCGGEDFQNLPGNPSSCAIPSTSLDLPDSLGGTYQVDVIAEFDTEEGQVAATTTTGVDSNPGLEFEVKNNGGEPVSGIEVSVQGESTTTNDNGVARFDSLGDSTIDEISLYCNEPSVQNTKRQYSIDPSARNTFELDLSRGVEECTSTRRR